MTTEQLPRPISDADKEFFERNRKLSPKFPDPSTALLRLQMKREALAARIMMGGAVFFGLCTPFAEKPLFMGAASLAFVFGFVVTCFVAGSRSHQRAGGRSTKDGQLF